MIPAAVYGEGGEAVAVAVNAREIANILRSGAGHNTIFKVALPGQNESDAATVIIKDWQVDPVKGRILHADLMRLSMTTATHVKVAIEAVGEPIGVKQQGGILDMPLRELDIECLPGDIPERIRVDVSALNIGDHLTVADLQYDREKVKILTDEHQIIAGVLMPRMVEEVAKPAEVEAAAPAAEPEVIKKGKTEEE
jgi:large subunit ribosomal protein L25